MKVIKRLIKRNFKFFSYYYSIVGYRMLLIVFLSLLVGLLDGFGLTMFLPLLELVGDNSSVSGEKLGNLKFITDLFLSLGIELDIISVLLIMLFFFILKGIARFFESYYKLLVSQRFVRKIRVDGIINLGNFSFERFMTSNSGRIQNTLSAEISSVYTSFVNYLTFIQAGVMLLVYIFLAYLANAQFALFITIGGVLSNFAFNVLYKKTKEFSRNIVHIQHGYQNLLIQTVANFKYLKATNFIKVITNKTVNEIDLMMANSKKMGFYNVIITATREPMIMTVVVFVILLQVFYFNQQLSLIVLSLLFFYRALNFVMNFQVQWNKILSSIGAIENMSTFMAEMKKHKTKVGGKDFDSLNSEIVMSNADFSYGQTKILKELNIEFVKNRTYALVGESGSGKTTLVNIIAGLLQLKGGNMTVDGLDLGHLDIAQYQSRIGYITQESVIFNDTIFNNVTFWQPKTPENYQRFLRAVDQASITDYINSLDEKEDALLGNNGINLSGGQKQRISIARELYKDIDILIMDEATSALDSETELAIQKNIDALKGRYTIFIVAHRLSTIKNCDKVILMDKGEVKVQGSYQELLEHSKKFQRMVSLQELIDA